MTFDPRDPRWKDCPVGCRPAANIHRSCPNAAADHCSLDDLAEAARIGNEPLAAFQPERSVYG